MTAQPIRNVDQLVDTYLDLADRIAALTEQQASVKHQLRDLGLGDHTATNGVVVKITPPSRRFNPKTAEQVLAPEVLQQCFSEGYDPKKLKSFLSPVLLDVCMDEGTGDPAVKVVTPS